MSTAEAVITIKIKYDTSELAAYMDGDSTILIKDHWKALMQYLEEDGAFTGWNDMTMDQLEYDIQVVES